MANMNLYLRSRIPALLDAYNGVTTRKQSAKLAQGITREQAAAVLADMGTLTFHRVSAEVARLGGLSTYWTTPGPGPRGSEIVYQPGRPVAVSADGRTVYLQDGPYSTVYRVSLDHLHEHRDVPKVAAILADVAAMVELR